MFQIPRAPLALGLAGLLPFLVGAFFSTLPDSGGDSPLVTAGDGIKMLVLYGTVILSFMSGVLWGFATKANGAKATTGYVLSVLPALWAFLARGTTDSGTLLFLAIGFAGLLMLDYFFHREALTPSWWMRLRILLTTIVVACLAVGALA
ncbi:DUF3429 domain-containing protein [Sulfitobacter sp. F26169L]|uniref:DUF3429 domain-containing protein n=1 Tax=Sulfitobacter sp. F26169L TaxID=2996015 RepID=UPI0022608326|nr:DUF3429 domain-containing protein [Sulfitobacter sp. F26169L]MCX7566760.1 DUF3429 domain-containing protein [Sulfitobacter sp. F26169L]